MSEELSTMSENFFVGRPYFFLIHTWNLTPCRSIPTSRNPVPHPPHTASPRRKYFPPAYVVRRNRSDCMAHDAILQPVCRAVQPIRPYAVRCNRKSRMASGAGVPLRRRARHSRRARRFALCFQKQKTAPALLSKRCLVSSEVSALANGGRTCLLRNPYAETIYCGALPCASSFQLPPPGR